jgi:predicted ester cyclase
MQQPSALLLAALAATTACSTTKDSQMTTDTTRDAHRSTEAANQQLIRRLYDECITSGRLELLPELIGDDYVGPRGERGPDGFAGPLRGLRAGFPDIHFTIEDLIAQGDRVSVRWSWRATHTGTFNGLAPTGKALTNTGMAIYRLAHGKVAQSWVETDRLGALQQLGLVPDSLGRPAVPPRN